MAKKLTVIASLVLVPSLIVGFYGQNFGPAFDEPYWSIGVSSRPHRRVDDLPARALPLAALDLSFGRRRLVEPDLELWDAWHPANVALSRLAGVDVPWYVAAGWALDLFRGGQTREHEDLEIAVPGRLRRRTRRAGGFEVLVPVGEGVGHLVDDRRRSRRAISRGCASPRRAPGGSTSSASRGTATRGSAGATRGSGADADE